MTTVNSTSVASAGNDDTANYIIPSSALLKVLQGVAVATKTSEEGIEPVVHWVSSYTYPHDHSASNSNNNQDGTTTALSFSKWHTAITSDLTEPTSQQLASLSLAVAFLREKSRQNQDISTTDLATIWSLIYRVLTDSSLTFSTNRSAQGFLAVPLCSLIKDGCIDELFRFHVWLPDGERGISEFSLHSHQPFAQSWILAGEGKDHSYKVEPVKDASVATHAEYALAWTDGKELGKAYKTHQIYSKVVNTGKLMRATEVGSAIHARDMSYSIPGAAFHKTEVAPDILHATLFFFDSHRGFFKDAGVLGPKDKKSSIQVRDPAGITQAALANAAEAVRSWEIYMQEGQEHARNAEWEHALRAFNSALHVCETVENFPNVTRYKCLVLGELGNTNRRFGRYEQAKDVLEKALVEMANTRLSLSAQCVEISGELGVIYRHMDRLEDAKRAFEIQYEMAKISTYKRAWCRAVGNLGMVNYQLSQRSHDVKLLELAIDQLHERVKMARVIAKETNDSQAIDPTTKARWLKDARTWETIGLGRLSLCYVAHGGTEQAVAAAKEALDLTISSKDATVIAMTGLLYGRALLSNGQREEALKQFNPTNGRCTPAIALCKEPSEEHRQYLRELIEAGADLDLIDEQGYKALDYAVFNGDTATEEVVVDGLRRKFEAEAKRKLEERLAEAKLRKGYREMFQEQLRPMLLRGSADDSLRKLRHVYADALAADEEKRRMFDGFKFVRYSDFINFGKLPRSTDRLAQRFVSKSAESDQIHTAGFVIFFSYRWINHQPGATTPDDIEHTQYRRMLGATEEFLKLHPSVDKESLGIWLDHACVDQDNPRPGVVALPMNLAQCNAMISLVDASYYTRAWCSVEVMMIQTLKRSYGQHLWYEQVEPDREKEGGNAKGLLREGPMDLETNMAEKQLTFETDRPKVLLLERQTKLLG